MNLELANKKLRRVSDLLRVNGLNLIAESVPLNRGRYGISGRPSDCTEEKVAGCEKIMTVAEGETAIHVPKELYLSTSKVMSGDTYSLETETINVSNTAAAWRVKNGRVYTHRSSDYYVVSCDNRLVLGPSYSSIDARSGRQIDQFSVKAKFFPKPVEFRGTVASLILGGGPRVNIGHWMLDALPRLKAIGTLCPLDEIDHFVVQGEDKSFRLESLEILGIPKHKIHLMDRQLLHISADELLVGSHPRGTLAIGVPDWVTSFHRDHYLRTLERDASAWPKKIYVSRRDSSMRGVTNEDELNSFLAEKGYVDVALSEYSYEDKVKLFAHADEIVSMSGAGLTFLLYCNPGTKVTELFPGGFVHYGNCAIANQLGLDYHYRIFGDVNQDASASAAQRSEMFVDLAALDHL